MSPLHMLSSVFHRKIASFQERWKQKVQNSSAEETL